MKSLYFEQERERHLIRKDGDGDIPTQELGTALRALGTYPSVGLLHLVAEMLTFYSGKWIAYENEKYWGSRYGWV